MKIRVLSIDGGGIRGIAPAHMLARLEQKLLDSGKLKVADSFELFVGTSTGCIVAAGLAASGQAAQPLAPKDIEQLYHTHGQAMFTSQWAGIGPFPLFSGKYKESAKGAVLRQILGNLPLGELERNFLGTFYNVAAGPGPIFPNGGPQYRNVGDNRFSQVPLWNVVNASSSAPFYFDPAELTALHHDMRGADGGLFANNPAMCGYVEAVKTWAGENGEKPEFLVASFGCGQSTVKFEKQKRWGVLQWAAPTRGVPLLEAMFDGQSETVHYQMKKLLEPENYFRLEFSLDGFGKIAMDDASDANIARILKATTDYLDRQGGDAELDRLAAAL